MGKYTADEIRAFKLKDILNSKMSALKAASVNNEGKGKSSGDIKAEAEAYYQWLREEQGDTGSAHPPDIDSPGTLGNAPAGAVLGNETLTLQQKAVMDNIRDKCIYYALPTDNLQAMVLTWAEKEKGRREYPTKVSSVDEFIRWYSTN